MRTPSKFVIQGTSSTPQGMRQLHFVKWPLLPLIGGAPCVPMYESCLS